VILQADDLGGRDGLDGSLEVEITDRLGLDHDFRRCQETLRDEDLARLRLAAKA